MALVTGIAQAYLAGVSTRRVDGALFKKCGRRLLGGVDIASAQAPPGPRDLDHWGPSALAVIHEHALNQVVRPIVGQAPRPNTDAIPRPN